MSHVAVIAGGDGLVGRGLVRAYLGAGATVVVPTRSADKARALQAQFASPQLHVLHTDLSLPAGAENLAQTLIGTFEGLDSAVASLGAYARGSRLIDLDPTAWDSVVASNLTAHFMAARTLGGLMAAAGKGSYLMINGECALAPKPDHGHVSVLDAAQMMMARVLTDELRPSGVRVNQIVVTTRVRPVACVGGADACVSADEIGRTAVWLALGEGQAVNGAQIALTEHPRPPATRRQQRA
jgi:NAD(P)-dependent dehydrogenase (short-subunit alcohol dehydrogenase family)